MTTTTKTSASQKSADDRLSAPLLTLSSERIHFATSPRATYRSSLRLRLVGGLVGRR